MATKRGTKKPPETPAEFKGYILRSCDPNMQSYGGFVWPESGYVAALDWKPTVECGYGLHGFLWGEGNGGLADYSPSAKWLVAGVNEWIDLDGKVKSPEAWVVFVGDRHAAAAHIISLGARGAVVSGTATAGVSGTATAGDRGTATAGFRGTATAGFRGTATAGVSGTATAGVSGTATAGVSGTATAGVSGTATAGDSGTATAGVRGTATAGDRGTATAGVSGTATAGDSGTATAGYGGTATAGDRGTATAGYGGTATAGDRGIIVIRYWDDKTNRCRLVEGYVGEDGIEANVPYRVIRRKLVRAS